MNKLKGLKQPENLDEHDDDKPIGRVLTRREMLAFLGIGGTGAALFLGSGLTKLGAQATSTPTAAATSTAAATDFPSCVVRPALTEGPYFVDGQLDRSDIRIEPSDGSVKEGTPLRIVFIVSDVSTNACVPLKGAQVDIWHCDAAGAYSGVNDPGFDTAGQKWLRGYQITDEDGMAEFQTIYPGWYSGRAVHIHFKIRTDPDADSGYEFTSQFFFDETLTDKIQAVSPYSDKGYRNTLNVNDNIYQGSDGLLTLNVVEADDGNGYIANFGIGLDLSQPAPTESGMGGGGQGGPGGGPGGQPPNGTPRPRP
ncbi:MAG: intradiol ring-cleavage dioxygenase [Anaerolineae bacterium]